MFKTFLKNHDLSEYNFSTDFFPTVADREYWNNFKVEGLIENAESYLDYPWPIISATAFMEFKRSGDRLAMENIHFERRRALSSLVFGELCENRGRFLPQIVNGIYAICEETFWGVSAHWYPEGKNGNLQDPREPYIDLFAAETAENLVMAYHFLREPLSEYCPEILDRIEYEIERRIKIPYLTHEDFWWMGYIRRPNNWNPWILSNLLSVFLICEPDEEKLRAAIFKMLNEIQNYYNALPEDGGCDEGPGYWSRAGASLFEFVYELKLASGGVLDLFDNEKLRGVAAYMKKVHIKDASFVCVADGTSAQKSALGPFIYAFGRETGQSDLEALGAEVYLSGGESTKTNLVTRGEGNRRRLWTHDWIVEIEKRALQKVTHPRLELMENLELACLRAGDWFLSAKGGHNNESHNHNDVGSFSLYHDGGAVIADIGIGTYTKQTFSPQRYEIPWVRSLTHSVPEINGIEQKEGREFAASEFLANEENIKVSFAGAYPKEAGVSALTRVYNLTDDGLSFTDFFEFIGDKKHISETLVTVLDAKIDGNTVILGEKFRITSSGGTPKIETISFEGDKKLTEPWGRDDAVRITFDSDGADFVTVKIAKI